MMANVPQRLSAYLASHHGGQYPVKRLGHLVSKSVLKGMSSERPESSSFLTGTRDDFGEK